MSINAFVWCIFHDIAAATGIREFFWLAAQTNAHVWLLYRQREQQKENPSQNNMISMQIKNKVAGSRKAARATIFKHKVLGIIQFTLSMFAFNIFFLFSSSQFSRRLLWLTVFLSNASGPEKCLIVDINMNISSTWLFSWDLFHFLWMQSRPQRQMQTPWAR